MKCQGFYDSVVNAFGVADRPYTAKDFRKHLKVLIGNGIGLTKATGDNAWKVEKTGNLQVKVILGDNKYNVASLDGNPFAVDEELSFDLLAGTDRWDSIIIRANATADVRLTDVILQEGSVDLIRNEDIYDLRLARIHVVNNVITEIIDDRLDYSFCGIANGLATVPTDELIELLNSVANGENVALKTGILQKNLNSEMLDGKTLEALKQYITNSLVLGNIVATEKCGSLSIEGINVSKDNEIFIAATSTKAGTSGTPYKHAIYINNTLIHYSNGFRHEYMGFLRLKNFNGTNFITFSLIDNTTIVNGKVEVDFESINKIEVKTLTNDVLSDEIPIGSGLFASLRGGIL